MIHWFQNLKKEDGRHWFNFRGWIKNNAYRTLFRYSCWSGPSLRLEYSHGSGDEHEASLTIGIGFATICLAVPLADKWCFKRKCIATWEGNKEFELVDGRRYGFYFYGWALVWQWHQREMESGSGPWWRKFYFRIDDFFLGRREYMTNDLCDAEKIKFKLGDKEFVMDSIRWYDATWFRRRIPLCLHEHKIVRVEMKINKPPMRAGKGENSWDCGDDGTFGLTMEWIHGRPNWSNKQDMIRLAVKDYVEEVLKDTKRYGSSRGERGITVNDAYEYLGAMS